MWWSAIRSTHSPHTHTHISSITHTVQTISKLTYFHFPQAQACLRLGIHDDIVVVMRYAEMCHYLHTKYVRLNSRQRTIIHTMQKSFSLSQAGVSKLRVGRPGRMRDRKGVGMVYWSTYLSEMLRRTQSILVYAMHGDGGWWRWQWRWYGEMAVTLRYQF